MTDLSTQVNEIAEEVYLGKVVRNGRVAVLYSPGYGAGWSSWNREAGEDIIFDPNMVKYIEEDNEKSLMSYVSLKYPGAYIGGLRDIKIAWIDEGTLFRIDEYDGFESIEILSDTSWIKA